MDGDPVGETHVGLRGGGVGGGLVLPDPVASALADGARQVWMIDPRHLEVLHRCAVDAASGRPVNIRAALSRLPGFGVGAAVRGALAGGAGAGKPYQVVRGVAVIDIAGVLVKGNDDAEWYGGTSYALIDRATAAALGDPEVCALLYRIDSPGGMAMPVEKTALRIVAARADRAGKPVFAVADDMAASAALYLGSQAEMLLATPGAWVGSIGCIMMHADLSGFFERWGVKVSAIKSTPTKDVGSPYRPLAERDREVLQAEVMAYDGQFIAALARGRGVSEDRAREWQKTRGFVGRAALSAGLVDGMVGGIDQAVTLVLDEALRRRGAGGASSRGAMAGAAEVVVADNTQSGGVPAASAGAPAASGGSTMPGNEGQAGQGAVGAGAVMAASPPATPGASAGPSGVASGGGGGAAAPVVATITPDGVTTERQRVHGIMAAAAPFAGDAAIMAERDAALTAGTSVEAFREKVLSKLGASRQPTGHVPVEVGAEERDKKRSAMRTVLLARSMPGIEERLEDSQYGAAVCRRLGFASAAEARRGFESVRSAGMAGMSLMLIAASCAAAATGQGVEQVLARVGDGVGFMNAAFATTSDFPKILADVAHKAMLARYEMYPTVWQKCCGRDVATDYKPKNYVNLSEAPKFQIIRQNAVPDLAKFNEKSESLIVDPYGRQWELTYQMIRNDDLGAFQRVPAEIGESARLLPEELFIALLALNSGTGPTMADGQVLYHSTHGNVITGSALSYSAAQADFTAFRKRTGFGDDAKPIDIEPRVLLVPVDLQWTAEDIANQQYVGDSNNPMKTNALRGRFGVGGTPRLTGTRRYWFADPAVKPAIVMSFLDGRETPEVAELPVTNPLARRWQATVYGVGCGAVDSVPTATNAGV